MQVVIGIDPHKASHTAVAVGRSEEPLSSLKVRATRRQVDQLLEWAGPFEKRTWAIESAGGVDGVQACVVVDLLHAASKFGPTDTV